MPCSLSRSRRWSVLVAVAVVLVPSACAAEDRQTPETPPGSEAEPTVRGSDETQPSVSTTMVEGTATPSTPTTGGPGPAQNQPDQPDPSAPGSSAPGGGADAYPEGTQPDR